MSIVSRTAPPTRPIRRARSADAPAEAPPPPSQPPAPPAAPEPGPEASATPPASVLARVGWLLSRLSYEPTAVTRIVDHLRAGGPVRTAPGLAVVERAHVSALLAGGYEPIAPLATSR